MKKSIRIALQIMATLLILGVVIIGIALGIAGGDLRKLSNQKAIGREVELQSFHDISIDLESGDVSLLPSRDGKYSVRFEESDCYYHTVEIEEGKLKIDTEDTRKWYQYIGFDFTKMRTTLYIPEGEYGNLSIKTESGSVKISTAYAFGDVSVYTSSGDIKMNVKSAGAVSLRSSSGDIDLQSMTATGDVAIKASSGEVELQSVSALGVRVEVSSGETDIEDVRCDGLYVKSSSGNIRLHNVISQGESKIRASSGNITLTACDAESYDMYASSGNVKGSILTSKIFMAKADSGSVKVPSTTTGGVCKVETGSGNIRLELYAE